MTCDSWPVLRCGWVGLATIIGSVLLFALLVWNTFR